MSKSAFVVRVRSSLDNHDANEALAAISMTICELYTASHSPPLECAAFSTRLHPAHTAANGESHTSCVE